MLPHVKEARHIKDYRVWVRFQDGTEGEINLEKELWGEVFEPLRDVSVFRQLRVDPELNTLVWPNGADFAPEFLYKLLRPDFTLDSNASKSGTG